LSVVSFSLCFLPDACIYEKKDKKEKKDGVAVAGWDVGMVFVTAMAL